MKEKTLITMRIAKPKNCQELIALNIANFKAMDPQIFYGIINTRLRMKNPNLKDFCGENQIDEAELIRYMEANGFLYNPKINQFR